MYAEANKVLALMPEAYWRLTPVELGDMMSGAVEREERHRQRTAWAVAHLLNISGKSLKRDVTADQLLGRAKVVAKDPVMDFERLWGHVQDSWSKTEH